MVLDVQRIRFSEEQRICEKRASFFDEKPVRPRGNATAGRRSLRARAMLLTETIAPDAVRALAEARSRLDVSGQVELYQSSRYEGSADFVQHGNACMHYFDPPCIEVVGHYLASLDPLALTAVLGHELGHLVAHGPGSTSDDTWRRFRPAEIERRLRVSRELTADRFGLLACRDLAAALRVEMISLAGLAGGAMIWDTETYLRDCRALVEELLRDGTRTLGLTHPEHGVRAYALWLFSESDVYREITGHGSGQRPLAEVDEQLIALLPPYSELRAPKPGQAAPSPPPTVPAPSPSPCPPPARAVPPPSAVPRIGAQLDYAMKDLRGKLSAMFAPAGPRAAEPASDDLSDDDFGDDGEAELNAKFAKLERQLAEKVNPKH